MPVCFSWIVLVEERMNMNRFAPTEFIMVTSGVSPRHGTENLSLESPREGHVSSWGEMAFAEPLFCSVSEGVRHSIRNESASNHFMTCPHFSIRIKSLRNKHSDEFLRLCWCSCRRKKGCINLVLHVGGTETEQIDSTQ